MVLKRVGFAFKTLKRRVREGYRDKKANRRFATAKERFLVLRHPGNKPAFYKPILDVLEREFPDIRARFELQLLPFRGTDLSPYRLCIPWMQDPVQSWSQSAYDEAMRLAGVLGKRGVATINPVDKLTHAAKVEGSERIRSAGIRTPRTLKIKNVEEFRETRLGLDFPIIIRDDWGHEAEWALKRKRVILCHSEQELQDVDLRTFRRPIAIEYIDTKGPDGFYRKYRLCTAGPDLNIPYQLQMKPHWFVKGADGADLVYTDASREEELSYVDHPDPNSDRLQAARRALDLDFVAFDYGYDQDQNLVVWEANPYPSIFTIEKTRFEYKNHAVIQTILAMAHLYLTRAGLPIPDALMERLEIKPA